MALWVGADGNRMSQCPQCGADIGDVATRIPSADAAEAALSRAKIGAAIGAIDLALRKPEEFTEQQIEQTLRDTLEVLERGYK